MPVVHNYSEAPLESKQKIKIKLNKNRNKLNYRSWKGMLPVVDLSYKKCTNKLKLPPIYKSCIH